MAAQQDLLRLARPFLVTLLVFLGVLAFATLAPDFPDEACLGVMKATFFVLFSGRMARFVTENWQQDLQEGKPVPQGVIRVVVTSVGCMFGAQLLWPSTLAADEEPEHPLGPRPLSRVLNAAQSVMLLPFWRGVLLSAWFSISPDAWVQPLCSVLLPAGPLHSRTFTTRADRCAMAWSVSTRPERLILVAVAAYHIVAEGALLVASTRRSRCAAALADKVQRQGQRPRPVPWPRGQDHGRMILCIVLQRTLMQAGATEGHAAAWRHMRPVLRLVDHGTRAAVDSQWRVGHLEAVMEAPVAPAGYDSAGLVHRLLVHRFLLRPCSLTGQRCGLAHLAELHVRDIDAHGLPLRHSGLWQLRSLTCRDVGMDSWVQMGRMAGLTQLVVHGTLRLVEGRWPCGPWAFGRQPEQAPPAKLLLATGPVGPPALRRLEVRGEAPRRQRTASSLGQEMHRPLKHVLLRRPSTLTHLSLCLSAQDLVFGHPVVREDELAIRRHAAVGDAAAASVQPWLYDTRNHGPYHAGVEEHAEARLGGLETLELAAASSDGRLYAATTAALKPWPVLLLSTFLAYPWMPVLYDGRTAFNRHRQRGFPLPPLNGVEVACRDLQLRDRCLRALLRLPSLRRLVLRGCSAAGRTDLAAAVERLQREVGVHVAVSLVPAGAAAPPG